MKVKPVLEKYERQTCCAVGDARMVLSVVVRRQRLLARDVARMHTLVLVHRASKLDGALGRAAGADGQDEVGVLIADHGFWIVGGVVRSSADHRASGAGDRLASWVAGVIGHRWVNDDTTLGERVAFSTVGVAVDVGQIPEDAVARPGVLELGDWARERVGSGELDRDADALFAIRGRVASGAKQLHAFGSAVDGGVVNVVVAVVENRRASYGHDCWSKGKQTSCANG